MHIKIIRIKMLKIIGLEPMAIFVDVANLVGSKKGKP